MAPTLQHLERSAAAFISPLLFVFSCLVLSVSRDVVVRPRLPVPQMFLVVGVGVGVRCMRARGSGGDGCGRGEVVDLLGGWVVRRQVVAMARRTSISTNLHRDTMLVN